MGAVWVGRALTVMGYPPFKESSRSPPGMGDISNHFASSYYELNGFLVVDNPNSKEVMSFLVLKEQGVLLTVRGDGSLIRNNEFDGKFTKVNGFHATGSCVVVMR